MKRILVVEDNPDLAGSLKVLLESWGHEVRAVGDGAVALNVARSYLPDVVLLDIGLPGMDGFQVGALLRLEPALQSALIVSMSAVVQPDDARSVLASGIDHHLTKPLDLGFLESLLGH